MAEHFFDTVLRLEKKYAQKLKDDVMDTGILRTEQSPKYLMRTRCSYRR